MSIHNLSLRLKGAKPGIRVNKRNSGLSVYLGGVLVKTLLMYFGALTISCLPLQGATIISNGGFETGDFSNWTVTHASPPSNIFVLNNLSNTGSYYARFGGATSSYDSIQQTLTTIAGNQYDLSFFLRQDYGDYGTAAQSQFEVFFAGSKVFDVQGGPFAYTLQNITVTATSASTVVEFEGFSVPGYFRLDDVSISSVSSTVPEPATVALCGVGLVLAGLLGRRKRRA